MGDGQDFFSIYDIKREKKDKSIPTIWAAARHTFEAFMQMKENQKILIPRSWEDLLREALLPKPDLCKRIVEYFRIGERAFRLLEDASTIAEYASRPVEVIQARDPTHSRYPALYHLPEVVREFQSVNQAIEHDYSLELYSTVHSWFTGAHSTAEIREKRIIFHPVANKLEPHLMHEECAERLFLKKPSVPKFIQVYHHHFGHYPTSRFAINIDEFNLLFKLHHFKIPKLRHLLGQVWFTVRSLSTKTDLFLSVKPDVLSDLATLRKTYTEKGGPTPAFRIGRGYIELLNCLEDAFIAIEPISLKLKP